MSKPYTVENLVTQLYSELTWRRRELSDLKYSIRKADLVAKKVLCRSLVTMCYAHWEGYVKESAVKYFLHITLKKKKYSELKPQYYKNVFLIRLEALYKKRLNTQHNCELIDSILKSQDDKFSYINSQLIDTKSNLNTDVISDLCIICGFENSFFQENQVFIDIMLLKKRNAIAHGQYDAIQDSEIDEFVDKTLSIMEHFRTLIENKIYTKDYLL